MADNTFTNKVNVVRGTFKWVIKNFSICKCKREALKSPIFTIGEPKKIYEYRMDLYPLGDKKESQEYLSLYLMSLNQFNTETAFTFYVIDNENKKVIREKSCKHTFTKEYGHGFSSFIKNYVLKKLKNFSIVCSITISTETDKIIKENDRSKMISIHRRLKEFDSLEKLMKNDEFSDVSLTVGGQIFQAHKCILANKSPVFAAMFKHNMKEKESNTVIIEDVEIDVFEEILRFVYIGEVECIEEVAVNLFIAADKYSLEGLKVLCVEYLKDSISVDDAVKYLELSDLYHLDELQQKILDFMAEHPKEIIDLPELKQAGSMKPELLLKVLRALALEMET